MLNSYKTTVWKNRETQEAARTLQAFGYGSPKNLFLRASGTGGWIATTAAQHRPELFRGLILESPLLDLERVVTNTKLGLHPHYLESWGSQTQRLKELSPLEEDTDFFPLDLLMILSASDHTTPLVGNLEWLRRKACRHPELGGIRVELTAESVPLERRLSPTIARIITAEEVDFILSTLRSSR